MSCPILAWIMNVYTCDSHILLKHLKHVINWFMKELICHLKCVFRLIFVLPIASQI